MAPVAVLGSSIDPHSDLLLLLLLLLLLVVARCNPSTRLRENLRNRLDARKKLTKKKRGFAQIEELPELFYSRILFQIGI